jgi:hypothetical protein
MHGGTIRAREGLRKRRVRGVAHNFVRVNHAEAIAWPPAGLYHCPSRASIPIVPRLCYSPRNYCQADALMRDSPRIDPDCNVAADEQLERLTRLAMEAAARATVNVSGYNERSVSDKILLPAAAFVVAAAIVGAVVNYAKLSSLETLMTSYISAQSEQHAEDVKRLDNLERHVYRGGPEQ